MENLDYISMRTPKTDTDKPKISCYGKRYDAYKKCETCELLIFCSERTLRKIFKNLNVVK
jgi:hypothetical protein